MPIQSPDDRGGTAGPPVPSADSLDQLFQQVLGELRVVARRHLLAERGEHTLSTTALIHEAYLRMAAQRDVAWGDRAQFFALAAMAMRRVLVDYARRHRALRRGGAWHRVPAVGLDARDRTGDGSERGVQIAAVQRGDELLALDEALRRLAEIDERLSRVVEFRYFAGFSDEETATALGLTSRTVRRDWAKARAWLRRELGSTTVEGADAG